VTPKSGFGSRPTITACSISRQVRSWTPPSGPARRSQAPSVADQDQQVLRAAFAHVDKKSREQFEIRTHKRLLDIPRPHTTDAGTRS